MYTVRRDFKRPDAELLAAFAELSTPLLADSMGRRNAMHHRIRPVYPSARFCGCATTVYTYRSDNLMLQIGLKLSRPGDVLVVNAENCVDAGYFGEIMATNAMKHGVRGLVIDGGVRDVEELAAMNFPTFASGVNPCGTCKNGGGSVNEPIACGDMCVSPGDIILGDDCGVAVVPLAEAETILGLARKKAAAEAEMLRRVQAGEDLFDIMDLEPTLKRIGVKYC